MTKDAHWARVAQLSTMLNELTYIASMVDLVTPVQWLELDKMALRLHLAADQLRVNEVAVEKKENQSDD